MTGQDLGMQYPTMEQVLGADRAQLLQWRQDLGSPTEDERPIRSMIRMLARQSDVELELRGDLASALADI